MEDETIKRLYARLEAGADNRLCAGHMLNLEAADRTAIFNDLLIERLHRKNCDIVQIRELSGGLWEQALHSMLFRFMGAPDNARPFEKLAALANFKTAQLYTSAPETLEALIIGCAGLLRSLPEGERRDRMRNTFKRLAQKHNLQQMSPEEWKTDRIYPNSHPLNRMVQIADIIADPHFGINTVIDCRTRNDVHKLFGSSNPRRPGSTKTDMLAVNVVAPLQYAYGEFVYNGRLCERAVGLLDSMPPENNRKVKLWRDGGLRPGSAADTQSLIQLTDNYCSRKRCRECPAGVRFAKKVAEACKL